MRPKEHPELIFDSIPKLYESHIKVFITHLSHVEEQLQRLPKQFCKMYTTRPLADQLLLYLRSRDADCNENRDFHIVTDSVPFQLRLSDGRRLEVMLSAGSELGHSLMALIRKPGSGPLLYYYSAVPQHDLNRPLLNPTYIEWIAAGTERLFLKIDANAERRSYIDYDSLSVTLMKLGREEGLPPLLKLPLFGFEQLVRQLSERVYGRLCLRGTYEQSYGCLDAKMEYFGKSDEATRIYICASSDLQTISDLESATMPCEFLQAVLMRKYQVPSRINLIQLSSLLRPQHISAIMGYHSSGSAPRVPPFLERYRSTYSPRAIATELQVPPRSRTAGTVEKPSTTTSPQAPIRPSATLRVLKKRQLCYVDDDGDDDN